MKPQNQRRPRSSSLSDQRRAILAEAICALIDTLLDLLIAVDPDHPFRTPSMSWERPAARRPHRRTPLIDDNSDLTPIMRLIDDQLDPAWGASVRPGQQSRWAYPARPVWDKSIRTSFN